MEIKLDRFFKGSEYTIGRMYIDGMYFCDTIEDTDRNLLQSMDEKEIKKLKIRNKTAIPRGRYEITLDVKSPKYSNFNRYKWSEPYDGYLPRLIDVKAFDGILIHVLNRATESSGCIGVGENKKKGMVINSTNTFHRLMKEFLLPAKERNEKIYIEIY